MKIDFLIDLFSKHQNSDALVWRGKVFSYAQFLRMISLYNDFFEKHEEVCSGTVVALYGDYSPRIIALLIVLIERKCIVVPITDAFFQKKDEFYEIAEVKFEISVTADYTVTIKFVGREVTHPINQLLVKLRHPGLVIFSSGSTGKSKAAVHDCTQLLQKFRTPRKAKRTIPFMLLDHIGGVNTILHTLSSAGTIVIVDNRNPETVCESIQNFRVQVLPTSPTFLNLLLLRNCHKSYDLSSLETIAYGAEPMPETTLKRLHVEFPHVQLVQNYGVSEIGVMRSHSESSESIWVKLGGDGYCTRVRDGMLEIKAKSAMLGYLNAPSPFTDDGWFMTGDVVEVKGDYFKILGRQSEIINIGGEKVYPAEVEGFIARMEGVIDVAITAEKHSIVGHIVKATVQLATEESSTEFRKRMVEFLTDKLPVYKVPQKITLTDQAMYGSRFKKMRRDI